MKHRNHIFITLLSMFSIYLHTYTMEKRTFKRKPILDIHQPLNKTKIPRQKIDIARQIYLNQKELLGNKRKNGEIIRLHEIIHYKNSLEEYNALIPEIDTKVKKQIIKEIKETTNLITQTKIKGKLRDLLASGIKKNRTLFELIQCHELLTQYIATLENPKNNIIFLKKQKYEKFAENINQQIFIIIEESPKEQNREILEENIISEELIKESPKEPTPSSVYRATSLVTKAAAIILTCILILYKYDKLFPILEKCSILVKSLQEAVNKKMNVQLVYETVVNLVIFH